MEKVDTSFMHWGVRGMRWGVRKRGGVVKGPASPEEVKLRITPGKPVKTSGGGGRPPSQDAKAAAAYRQIARSSSSSALTNKQLQAVVTRIKLEQEWSKIVASEREANKGKIRKYLDKFASQEVAKIQQGKPPSVLLIARSIQAASVGSGGKHRKG